MASPWGPRTTEVLRTTVQDAVGTFLMTQWRVGMLKGTNTRRGVLRPLRPDHDAQEDVDNGRLICHIRVAAQRPAEFVIFRVGQRTADRSP